MVFPSLLKFAGSTPALKLQDLNLIPTGTPRDAGNFPINLGVFKGKLMRPLGDTSSNYFAHQYSFALMLNLDNPQRANISPRLIIVIKPSIFPIKLILTLQNLGTGNIKNACTVVLVCRVIHPPGNNSYHFTFVVYERPTTIAL